MGLAACSSSSVAGPQAMSASFYVRTDSNATDVISPRLRAAARVSEEATVEATYSLDSWTGASVDITTAATGAVHEIRQEITGGGNYATEDVTVSGSYRYSTENDYWSNGGVLTGSVDLAQKNTTLSLSLLGSSDIVGRAGDPLFRRPQRTAGARTSLTQVLDPKTLLSVSLELIRVTGYQASPYRFVALGGDGVCAGTATLCVPESHPSLRDRAAAVFRVRRALGDKASVGAEYRLYFDDWGVLSNTLTPDFVWLLTERDNLTLSYRYYQQTGAKFYRARYSPFDSGTRYVSRDRELSPLYSQRASGGYQHDFVLGQEGRKKLQLGMRGALTRYAYEAFVGLSDVLAIEASAMLGLEFL